MALLARRPIHSQQKQIAHGKFETKPDGSFVLRFDAFPDYNVPEETEPTFLYLIHADVTDGSGETRRTIADQCRLHHTGRHVAR